MSSFLDDDEMDAVDGSWENLVIGRRAVDERHFYSPSVSYSLEAQPAGQDEGEVESLLGNDEDEDEEDLPAWMVNVPTLTLDPRPKRGRLAPLDSALMQDPTLSLPLPSSLLVPFIDETIAKAKRMKTMPPITIPNDKEHDEDDLETMTSAPRARAVSSGSVSLVHPTRAADVSTSTEASPFRAIQSPRGSSHFALSTMSDAFPLDVDNAALFSTPKKLQPRKIRRHTQEQVLTVSKHQPVRFTQDLFVDETRMEDPKMTPARSIQDNTNTHSNMPSSSIVASAFSRQY